MFRTTAILLLAAANASAQTATITIEASHGGAGNGLTNTTIEVPLHTRYANPALDTVSTLYLTGADGVPLDSITCTPYRYNNLTGAGGLPFNSTAPSFLSTNTVQVASLLCNTTSGPSTTSSARVTSTLSATSSLSTTTNASVVPVTTTARNLTSVYLTTVSPTQAGPSTVTSVFTGSEGPTTMTLTSMVNGASPTSSASPSLNSESAADGNRVQKWLAQGMAVVGAALVAALRENTSATKVRSVLIYEARVAIPKQSKCPVCDVESDLEVPSRSEISPSAQHNQHSLQWNQIQIEKKDSRKDTLKNPPSATISPESWQQFGLQPCAALRSVGPALRSISESFHAKQWMRKEARTTLDRTNSGAPPPLKRVRAGVIQSSGLVQYSGG
ncbi:uncharacterized protein MYCFIDRAFT_195236 [Pseudocercospora fijiensis CIRAD86]|uniref:Uncharacterized protein n=1 Tax=Pseudocercospora fijiensis (strain CIRAD86) TaxID=383855 RepID=M2ZYQ8_PSEFD|nr:uncharacterized protein MYCFIDRAFT_195236 [Pseudocercospora fijiensis CIRAD86]EME84084.1 hypothetical protein MYCFIDRAFT_195236 [Pseudocercospora fijiensis CIRAD86]